MTLGKLVAAIIRVAGAIRPRFTIGRRQPMRATLGEEPFYQLKALLATLAAIAVIALIAYQIYDLKDPLPGATPVPRQIFGKVIAPSACYSSALGAIWRTDDDLRFIWDSTFEQIAYGTFPWGLLAPIAFAALLTSADRRRLLAASARGRRGSRARRSCARSGSPYGWSPALAIANGAA